MPVGVLTAKAKEKWAHALGNLSPYAVFKIAASFKIGEGGWMNTGSGPEPRTPDGEMTDLDIILNPSRYPAPNDSYYSKAFIPADYSFIATRTLQLRCRLNAGEYDFNTWAVQPQMWELGIFDVDGDMITYFTFPMQQKTLGMALEDYVTIEF